MKINENSSKGSGYMERTRKYGLNDNLTDEGHSYSPTSAWQRGINKIQSHTFWHFILMLNDMTLANTITQ